MKTKANSRAASLTLAALLASAIIVPAAMPAQSADNSSGKMVREGNDWIQESNGTLNGARNLRVKVDIGSVEVHGGGDSQIRYTVRSRSRNSSDVEARKQLGSYKLTTYVHGDTAWIMAEWQGRHAHNFSTQFSITVPKELDLAKIETDSGTVDLGGISGRAEVSTGCGSVHVADVGGSTNAETMGGNVDLGVIGGDVAAHSGGGSIIIHSAKGKITAETGGGSVEIISGGQDASVETGAGSITVRKLDGKLTAETGGGTVNLGDIGGPAIISTGGGSIRLTSSKGPVKADTGSGGIELYGVPSARVETGAGGITVKLINSGSMRNDSSLETSAGDITVYIAPDVGVTVRASIELANGHNINSDFGGQLQVNSEGGQWQPKTITAEGKVNGGGPMLKLRTTTGDINLRAAK